MIDLANQTALVTGASRGIGRAIAARLAEAGARVIIHYANSADAAQALVEEIRAKGGKADALGQDLAAPDGAHKLAEQVKALGLDRLDILVPNAGTAFMKPFEEETVEEFDTVYAVNVRAPFFLVQQLLPLLGEGSRIVFVSSVVARAAVEGLTAYSGTKGAIDTLVLNLAAYLGKRGIRVNAIAPGVIETDLASFVQTEAGRDMTLSMQALKRIGQPEDIADAVLFLSSDLARWVDGRTLEASGGARL
jgi:3-oxoacyl-[acyl-carrier protein] reductase